MKKAIQTTVLAVLASVMLASAAFAEYVYVTKSGKKFHHADSKFSEYEGAEKLSLEEAIERGYEPSKGYEKFKAQEDQAKAEKKK